jgi:hypothetical protein
VAEDKDYKRDVLMATGRGIDGGGVLRLPQAAELKRRQKECKVKKIFFDFCTQQILNYRTI